MERNVKTMLVKKVQYHDNGKVWEYILEGFRCNCGANVFHRVFDGGVVFGVCNGCGRVVWEIKSEFTKEVLSEGGMDVMRMELIFPNYFN